MATFACGRRRPSCMAAHSIDTFGGARQNGPGGLPEDDQASAIFTVDTRIPPSCRHCGISVRLPVHAASTCAGPSPCRIARGL